MKLKKFNNKDYESIYLNKYDDEYNEEDNDLILIDDGYMLDFNTYLTFEEILDRYEYFIEEFNGKLEIIPTLKDYKLKLKRIRNSCKNITNKNILMKKINDIKIYEKYISDLEIKHDFKYFNDDYYEFKKNK